MYSSASSDVTHSKELVTNSFTAKSQHNQIVVGSCSERFTRPLSSR